MGFQPNPTLTVDLPGGAQRIRELILYVAERCVSARYFGAIKLNKIIWKADFDAFSARRRPVTGREYRRRAFGPALYEMLPVHRGMLRDGLIEISRRDFGDGVIEHRTEALVKPNLAYFTADDIRFVDDAIVYYWDKTGTEASDESHGAAWKTRRDGDPMPYDLALLSDEPLSERQRLRIEQSIYDRGWIST